MEISGYFTHFKARGDLAIQGAPPGSESAFREEVWGANFSVSVSHLPAGKYTVVIGEAEAYFSNAGQRVFNITCGDTTLANNFDIVAAAGGAGKVYYLTGQVEHAEDAIHGPLTVKFTGQVNNAKFNTLGNSRCLRCNHCLHQSLGICQSLCGCGEQNSHRKRVGNLEGSVTTG